MFICSLATSALILIFEVGFVFVWCLGNVLALAGNSFQSSGLFGWFV